MKILRKYPSYAPVVAVIGDSQTKHLLHHFDPRSRVMPTMFVSRSGGRILDFLEEVDQLPASVRIVVLHCGTNDMPHAEPVQALRDYERLIQRTRARGNIQMAVCTLVLPRSRNRRLPYTGRRREYQCNPRATAFNRRLVQLCRRSKDLCYLDHLFHRRPPTQVLAADGLHPNFNGVRLISQNLRDLLPRLLRRLPPHRPNNAAAPDPVWPTPQEAATIEERRQQRQRRPSRQD